MANDYYTLVTAAGRALEVQAKATNVPVTLSLLAVGDGGGEEYNPVGTEVALRGEKWRGNLNTLLPHPTNPAWLIAEAILPDQQGGWWVREAGLLTNTGVLYAIAKYPPTFKPILAAGANKMLYVRMIFEVTNEAEVTLMVDPSIVLATRSEVQEIRARLDDKLDRPLDFGYLRVYAAPPGQKFADEIYVRNWGEMVWVETEYFTGYRSPFCGRPVDGHTRTPLVREVDAVGGLLSKATYAGLWGYAQENGLVVDQATWMANIGAHYFVDVSSTQFRVPDLRNMFRRFTGTDADTANARVLGSRQLDELRSHAHAMATSITGQTGDLATVFSGGGVWLTNPVGGAETRSINGAYDPRIHV